MLDFIDKVRFSEIRKIKNSRNKLKEPAGRIAKELGKNGLFVELVKLKAIEMRGSLVPYY